MQQISITADQIGPGQISPGKPDLIRLCQVDKIILEQRLRERIGQATADQAWQTRLGKLDLIR